MVLDVQDGLVYELSVTAFVDAYAVADFEQVLLQVFEQLYRHRVLFEGMILKPNMVVPGLACATQESIDEVAAATVKCMWRAVPAALPGITFLSGGQTSELASARLNAMNEISGSTPWALSFSFGPDGVVLTAAEQRTPISK